MHASGSAILSNDYISLHAIIVHAYKMNENGVPYEADVFKLGVYKHFVRAIMNQWTVPPEWNTGM